MLAPHPADTAPKDGRVIRGWFSFEGGARMVAVNWCPDRSTWVDLLGNPIPEGEVLKNWGNE